MLFLCLYCSLVANLLNLLTISDKGDGLLGLQAYVCLAIRLKKGQKYVGCMIYYKCSNIWINIVKL